MTLKTISKKEDRIKRQTELKEMTEEQMVFETRMAAIQTLIPLGMQAVLKELNDEFERLIGERHARGKPMGPWGENPGYVYLGDQKVHVSVPRVRRKGTDAEVPLQS